MPAKISLIGQTFGKLKVLSEAEPRTIAGVRRIYYLCQCECGKQKEILNVSLRTGRSKSCGCWMPEAASRRFLRHGHSVHGKISRTYRSWIHMKSRCYDPKGDQYKDYGGRGITVCDRWMSFANFLEDMGECPERHSIDRIDNDGNYEKGNCKWSTPKEQRRNCRTSHIVNVAGFKGCFVDAAAHFGIPHGTAHSRLRYGWTYEQIFLTPVKTRKPPPEY